VAVTARLYGPGAGRLQDRLRHPVAMGRFRHSVRTTPGTRCAGPMPSEAGTGLVAPGYRALRVGPSRNRPFSLTRPGAPEALLEDQPLAERCARPPYLTGHDTTAQPAS
jgi:hypothetical protein